MKILAIDTSGPVAGAAVLVDGCVRHAVSMEHGNTHSETIMPAVDQALSGCGFAAKDMDCIAVTAGPGSFTGVRIGVCAAKALAHATGAMCARIDALEALAAKIERNERRFPAGPYPLGPEPSTAREVPPRSSAPPHSPE